MPNGSKRDEDVEAETATSSFLREISPPATNEDHSEPHEIENDDDGDDTAAVAEVRHRRNPRVTDAVSSAFFISATSAEEVSASPAPSAASQQQSTTASPRLGWRARLFRFLFPGEDTTGVEGAAAHYGGGVGHSRPAVVKGDAAVRDSMEAWHYIRVPLSRVVLFLRLQQRLADLWTQGCTYVPFYALLLVFALIGPGHGGAQTVVDFSAVRRDTSAIAPAASTARQAVLMEAFRLNTEATAEPTTTSTVGAFVPGGSTRYPWTYSWYNETVNVWTSPPNPQLAVDAQVESVASTHHEPTFLSLTSIRTRRGVLRWLQLQFVPRLWNCENAAFERPWHSTMTGGRYQLGAVRLISRRYAQSTTDAATGGKSAQLTETDRYNVEVATPIIFNRQAAPPDIPSAICNTEDLDNDYETAPTFNFDSSVGGYVALLPFAASCTAVRNTLSLLETPKKRVLWPPAYNTSLEMQEEWLGYTETDRDINTSAANAASSCPSFLFDPAVSEILLQYVEYATATNRLTVVEVRFSMATGGAVVQPRLVTYALSALRWRFSFNPFALSICLALTILFYGNYLLHRMVAQYAARVARIARPRRTRAQRLWCALLVFLRTQNLIHLLALVLAAATLGSWWRALGRLTNLSLPQYADRDDYPQDIDHVVRQAGVVLPRLCAGAVFFATFGLTRFASVTPGLWVCMQTISRCTVRLAFLFCLWMTVNVGVAMLCVLLYGSALDEFRTFGQAFTMLIFMFLDGGRGMMNAFTISQQTGRYSILPEDNSLPGIRGSRLGRTEPVPLDPRSVTLSMSSIAIYPIFLLFFFYFQGVVVIVWGVTTIVEGYRNVLLLREAAVLPLWRGVWTLQFTSLTRTVSAEYSKEVVRRVLLSRGEAVMLRDVEYYLRLGYAQPPAAAAETALSLTMALWLLPRELQSEYGAAHLRRLWYLCVAAVLAAQREAQPWKSVQWQQHWAQQPNSLSGWLRASLPEDDTIEEQAARVGMQLEELPGSVVRYVAGKFT